MSEPQTVALIWPGKPVAHVKLTKTPLFIKVGDDIMVQITDPDTGEFLGGYAYTTERP